MKGFILILVMMVVFSPIALAKGQIQDGLCTVYLGGEEGFLFQIETQKDSNRDGVAVQFYSDGEVEKIARYKEGVLHGTYYSFWSNGQERSIVDYYNGILYGRAYQYDREGRPQVELNYVQGKLEGIGKYYENGALTGTVEYHKNKAVIIK